MNERAQQFSSRRDDVVVEEVAGELLVYDRTTDVAHCLSEVAAVAWRSFDGGATLDHAAGQILAGGLATSLEEARTLAAAAADELSEKGLLEQQETPGFMSQRVPRRQALRRMAGVGAAAVAGPLVVSAAIPSAALANCVAVLPTKIWYVKQFSGSDWIFEIIPGSGCSGTNPGSCCSGSSSGVTVPTGSSSSSLCYPNNQSWSYFNSCSDVNVVAGATSYTVSSTDSGEIPQQSLSFMLCPDGKYYEPTLASGGVNGSGELVFSCPSSGLVSCVDTFNHGVCQLPAHA